MGVGVESQGLDSHSNFKWFKLSSFLEPVSCVGVFFILNVIVKIVYVFPLIWLLSQILKRLNCASS